MISGLSNVNIKLVQNVIICKYRSYYALSSGSQLSMFTIRTIELSVYLQCPTVTAKIMQSSP